MSLKKGWGKWYRSCSWLRKTNIKQFASWLTNLWFRGHNLDKVIGSFAGLWMNKNARYLINWWFRSTVIFLARKRQIMHVRLRKISRMTGYLKLISKSKFCREISNKLKNFSCFHLLIQMLRTWSVILLYSVKTIQAINHKTTQTYPQNWKFCKKYSPISF